MVIYEGLVLTTQFYDQLIFWSCDNQNTDCFKGTLPPNSSFETNCKHKLSSFPNVVWQLNVIQWTLMTIFYSSHSHSHVTL